MAAKLLCAAVGLVLPLAASFEFGQQDETAHYWNHWSNDCDSVSVFQKTVITDISISSIQKAFDMNTIFTKEDSGNKSEHDHRAAASLLEKDPIRKYKHCWLGVILCSLGCLSSAAGLLLMKASGETESELPLYLRRKWALGFIFLVVNATAIDMIAYSLMPLALVAPFSGLTIVFSTLLVQSGFLSVREDISRTKWVAIFIVCVGVATISVCGPRSSQELTENNINTHLSSVQLEIFAGFCFFAIAVATAVRLRGDYTSIVPVVIFATGASAAGALANLSLKVLSNSLREYLAGHHALLSLPTIIGVVGLLICAPPQLWLLNGTLNGPVSFAVPLYQTLLILFTIVAGYTFFDEFHLVGINWMICFCSGITLAIAGLLGLGADTAKEVEM